jgi:hypothetical protein
LQFLQGGDVQYRHKLFACLLVHWTCELIAEYSSIVAYLPVPIEWLHQVHPSWNWPCSCCYFQQLDPIEWVFFWVYDSDLAMKVSLSSTCSSLRGANRNLVQRDCRAGMILFK